MRDVVVVGASLAGLRAVESLRTAGFDGSITVIGDERHMPYDRPPLSKRLLGGEWEVDRIALRKPEDIASLDVEWRLSTRAVGLDIAEHGIELDGGEHVRFEGAILATVRVASCRTVTIARSLVVLRSVDDR